MSYQPRSTNPYIMEKKLNKCVGGGGGGFDPSVLEEIEADISVLGSENATMAQDIIDIKGSLNSINSNLTDGIGGTTDKFRFGTDGNGNYGYIKKVAGADTFFPFNTSKSEQLLIGTQLTTTYTTYNLLNDLSKYNYVLFKTAYVNNTQIPSALNVLDDNDVKITNKMLTTDYFLNNVTELTVGVIMGANENDSVKHILVKKINDNSVQLKGKTSSYTSISIWGIS